MNRFIPVHDNTQLLVRVLQTVVDLGSSLHAFHNSRHFLRNPAQGIQVTPPHLHHDAAAAHGAHIHAGSIHGNLRFQILGLLLDDPGYLIIAHGLVFFCHHIDRGAVGASPAPAQQRHVGAAGHGAYILNVFNRTDGLHHLVGNLSGLRQSSLLPQRHIDGELSGIHI